MNTLVKDWCDYCEGKVLFDKSHFSSLFTHSLNNQELNEVFKFFANSNDLIERLISVKGLGTLDGSPYLHPLNRGDSLDIVEFVKLDLEDRRLLCVEQGDDELAGILARVGVEFVEDNQIVKQLSGKDNPSEWFFEMIGDLVDQARGVDPKMLALEEACYGLAANYYLAWFIMNPLLKLSIDFSNYFKVWSNGGIFVITESKVLVAKI